MAVVLAAAAFFLIARETTPHPLSTAAGTHKTRKSTSDGDTTTEPKPTTSIKRAASVVKDIFNVPAVAAYLAASPYNVTAAVYDAVTGYTSIYRPGDAEQCASIMKVDILATLLAEAQAQGVTALPSDQQVLAQQMIEESNDDDAQDLWNTEGGAAAVGHFDAEAGLNQTDPNTAGFWGESTTTAADQLQLLKKVAYPNSLLTDASRSYELGLMTNVDPTQAWGISAGVPTDVTVALKNGWLPYGANNGPPWQVNSIGYVNGEGRNYLIAVLVNGESTEEEGIQTIQGLSSLIWQDTAPQA